MDLPSILNQIRHARQVNKQTYAIDLVRRLIVSDIPPGPVGHEILGHALDLGDEDGALEVAKSMARHAPDDPQTQLILAERYARVGQSGIALDIVEALKASQPPNPAIDHYLSVYCGHVGQLDAAADHARAAIAQKPDFGDAWVILASLGRLEAGDRAALAALVQARG